MRRLVNHPASFCEPPRLIFSREKESKAAAKREQISGQNAFHYRRHAPAPWLGGRERYGAGQGSKVCLGKRSRMVKPGGSPCPPPVARTPHGRRWRQSKHGRLGERFRVVQGLPWFHSAMVGLEPRLATVVSAKRQPCSRWSPRTPPWSPPRTMHTMVVSSPRLPGSSAHGPCPHHHTRIATPTLTFRDQLAKQQAQRASAHLRSPRLESVAYITLRPIPPSRTPAAAETSRAKLKVPAQ